MRKHTIKLATLGAGLLLAATVVAMPTAANAAPASTQSVGTCTTVKTFSAPGGKKYTAPVTSGGSRDCRLEQGNQSSAVTRLQQELKNGCEGDHNITVDGQFGPATKSALQDAQKSLGISADGIYGSQSASKFAWLTTDGNLCYTPGI
ncbi:peptidoglycan-binding domain-containing protein [Curtobacterium sp. MCLR17_032]|uniref:peptidoglycan-binding domain-containing protein n=1 Tax=Curtobacterium sp. MCLR17_032 TaxID=2175650 RepID=UPI000DA883A3|nr:peptidoglycan-binding domain-containing protein [Curtobacterium sp. MCLR17_032]WIE61420.1 peptidoglycan-binding domain-containing protein [Curtobacterium sp. MCLR17_032]